MFRCIGCDLEVDWLMFDKFRDMKSCIGSEKLHPSEENSIDPSPMIL